MTHTCTDLLRRHTDALFTAPRVTADHGDGSEKDMSGVHQHVPNGAYPHPDKQTKLNQRSASFSPFFRQRRQEDQHASQAFSSTRDGFQQLFD